MIEKEKNKEVTRYNDFIVQKDKWLKIAKAKEKAKISAIKKGFVETVVVFIDMVDSTKFKIKYNKQPQKWINKVYQFSLIVKKYVQDCNGIPVKYIGDEVMFVFKGKSKIKDTLNLLMRINDLENDISTFTKSKTQVKVSVDYGDVYNLNYQGHDEPDPQGTPVDRCARIAKFCKPSSILTSANFKNECDDDHAQLWHSLGRADLKGIGTTEIFQYGAKTIKLVEYLTPYTENWFQILNKASGKAIDVKGYSVKDGALVYLWSSHGGDNQIWELHHRRENLFSIMGKQSEKCLEVKNGSLETEIIQQNTFTGASHQLWEIISNNDGSYFIIAQHSKKYLEQDAQTVTLHPGRLIQHEECESDVYHRDHQKWILKPVSTSVLIESPPRHPARTKD